MPYDGTLFETTHVKKTYTNDRALARERFGQIIEHVQRVSPRSYDQDNGYHCAAGQAYRAGLLDHSLNDSSARWLSEVVGVPAGLFGSTYSFNKLRFLGGLGWVTPKVWARVARRELAKTEV